MNIIHQFAAMFRKPWPVLYQWVGEDGLVHHGHSVGEGKTQEEAERKFFRQHPHVKPISVSRESSRGSVGSPRIVAAPAHITGSRPQVGPSTIHGTDVNLGLSVPVLAEPINRKPPTEAVVEVCEAQEGTKATPRGDRMSRTPAADKPLTNCKDLESYL